MPERASAQDHATVTSPLYQPAAFGAVVATPERVGSVLSMLMCWAVRLALLPAVSWAVPVTLWFAPSCRVFELEQSATPDRPSAQEKVTETSWLNQPCALGSPDNAAP